MSQLGLAGGVAGGDGAIRGARLCASAPAFRFSGEHAAAWFRRAACGRRPLPPRSARRARASCRCRLVEGLLADQPVDEDRWAVDGDSECLVPRTSAAGPFRVAIRSSARRGPAALRIASRRIPPPAWSSRRDAGLWTRGSVRRRGGHGAMGAPVRGALFAAGRFRLRRRTVARMGPVAKRPSGSLGIRRTAPASDQPAGSARYWLLSLFTPSERTRWIGGAETTPLSRAADASRARALGRVQKKLP